MYLSIIILIGTIVLLFGYIKFHIDLQFSPDQRKWYEKIRFLFPLLVIPIFGAIYYFWNMYPDILIDRDSQTAPMETGAQLAWTIEGLLTPQSSPEPMTKFEEIGSKYGTFGDSYGSLNTLFTGFAFSGLIISIFIQLLELRQTRKELSGQKIALVGQERESKKQTEILVNQQKIIDGQFKESQKQSFVNQFYSLLEQRNNILKNLTLNNNGLNFNGNRVISEYVIHFRKIRSSYDFEIHNPKYFFDEWERFTKGKFGHYDYQVKNYFKFYRTIFNFISKSTAITDNEKKIYINIVKTFISVDEQSLLIWMGIYNNSIKIICNRYALLDEIYNKELEILGCTYFNKKAFGNTSEWKIAFIKPRPENETLKVR